MRHEISVSEFSPVVREFASYKTVIQGCSQRTVEQYLIDLRTFFRYLSFIQHNNLVALANGRNTLRNDDFSDTL